MKRFLTAYVTTFILFIAMDFVWLTLMTSRLYQAQIGGLLMPRPDMVPGVLFYALYMVGLVVFVELPALERKSWTRATLAGVLFGIVAYGTYDLTNLATMKGFTLTVTLADMAWGAVVSAVAATAGYAAARRVR